MRRPSSSRYDVLTSAGAWAQMGKLDARVFQGLQTELDKLSWSAGHMRTQSSPARTTLETTELVATCDVDHVARRITLLSIVTRAHKALRDSVPNESEGA